MKLSRSMTQTQFDNGYWYAVELKKFAESVGVPSAGKLRKDELEKAIKHLLRSGTIAAPTQRSLKKTGPRDIDLGLRLDLPIVHYTSNKVTKDFIAREAARLVRGFKRKPGTRYLLNRWREERQTRGVAITYGDLVQQAIVLNDTKVGPLRTEHGRYMNFVSDFMAWDRTATRKQLLKAWKEVKAMDAPKTFKSWKAGR